MDGFEDEPTASAPPPVPSSPRPTLRQKQSSRGSLLDSSVIVATPALLKSPQADDNYDNLEAELAGQSNYDRLPGQGGRPQGETAPVLIEADDDEGEQSDYMTPRAMLEPEWLHGQMSRSEAEEMIMVSIGLHCSTLVCSECLFLMEDGL